MPRNQGTETTTATADKMLQVTVSPDTMSGIVNAWRDKVSNYNGIGRTPSIGAVASELLALAVNPNGTTTAQPTA